MPQDASISAEFVWRVLLDGAKAGLVLVAAYVAYRASRESRPAAGRRPQADGSFHS
jgi:hypothetical protein